MTEDAFVAAYRPLAYRLARGYFAPGLERDDLRQEALVGVMKAYRSWRPGHAGTVASFVRLCVTRQLVTALKTAQREKHGPLNDAYRTLRLEGSGEIVDTIDAVEEPDSDPADVVERRERLRAVVRGFAGLTPLERQCVVMFANGRSYAEMDAVIGTGIKSADNALTRARRKLREAA
jgi:RNA polymerase sporulation-specific sigma factor